MKTREQFIEHWQDELYKELLAGYTLREVDPEWIFRRIKAMFPKAQKMLGAMYDHVTDAQQAPPKPAPPAVPNGAPKTTSPVTQPPATRRTP